MSLYLFPRTLIAINKLALKILKFPVPDVVRGVDSSLQLCQDIRDSGVQRVLLVTDEPLLRTGIPDRLAQRLRELEITVQIFSQVVPDPDYALVLKGVACLDQSGAQAVLAVGGGSPIDCAKAMLMCQATRQHPKKLKGVWLYHLPRKRGLALYAIPTTAGTGSEGTIAAVVSDRAEQTKYSIIDPKLIPTRVALDPALTVGLPAPITAATGMDALTHAVEAYTNTTSNPQTDSWCIDAVQRIAHYLPLAYADGSDMQARAAMQEAALHAGLAFTRAGVGYIHAIAHQLGAHYHLPHGLANAIVMPYVLDFLKPACEPRLADLARAADLAQTGDDESQAAQRFIDWIRDMNVSMQIPMTVSALQTQDFENIIDHAFREAHGTYPVPRYMQRNDARAILQALQTKSPD